MNFTIFMWLLVQGYSLDTKESCQGEIVSFILNLPIYETLALIRRSLHRQQ